MDCLKKLGLRKRIGAIEKHRAGSQPRGISLGMMRNMQDFAPGFIAVFLEVQEVNQRAIGLYEMCGFRREGVLRGAYERDGKRENKVVMGILREDFPAAEPPARLDAPESSRNKQRSRAVSGRSTRGSRAPRKRPSPQR